MGPDNIAVLIEQGGSWDRASPVVAIPSVDLNAFGVAMEVSFATVLHLNVSRHDGRTVIAGFHARW